MELKLSDRVIKLPNSLGELPLRKYFEIIDIMQDIPKDDVEGFFGTMEGQLKFFDVLDVLVPDSDDVLVGDLNDLTSAVQDIIMNYKPTIEPSKTITINDVVYSVRTIRDMNDLTTGEYISIKMLQERYKTIAEFAPYILAVLVRPAKEEIDEETGELRWVQSKFDKRDIGNMDWRAKLFMNEAKTDDLLPVLNFFLIGNKIT